MATTEHPDDQHADRVAAALRTTALADHDPSLPALQAIRMDLIRRLATALEDPGPDVAQAPGFASAILSIDQVIHANRPTPRHVDARQIARDQKAALEAAWGACSSTTDGDRVVAALRATALFGAF